MGLVHVFLFLNVKDGPSRFRMASFYAVRLFTVVNMLFCIPRTAQPHWVTHRAAAHTHRRIVCSVILTSACLQWRKAFCRWLMVWPSLLLQFMLVENATLLLAASDFLSEASWDSMTLPTSVLCSFLLGESLYLHALSLFWNRFVSDVLMFNGYN